MHLPERKPIWEYQVRVELFIFEHLLRVGKLFRSRLNIKISERIKGGIQPVGSVYHANLIGVVFVGHHRVHHRFTQE